MHPFPKHQLHRSSSTAVLSVNLWSKRNCDLVYSKLDTIVYLLFRVHRQAVAVCSTEYTKVYDHLCTFCVVGVFSVKGHMSSDRGTIHKRSIVCMCFDPPSMFVISLYNT